MALFNILIDIATRTANFESGMDRVDRRLQSFGEGFKRVTGLLAAGGLTVFLADTAKQALETGDQLAHLATKAGTSGQAFSELAYAAKISNSSQEDLAKSLRFMNRALSEAATGSKEQNDALAALGLTTKDFIGLETDKKFELIADRISKMKDEGDKARASTVLLGKAGGDLGDLFEKGAKGIEAARAQARQIGQSFTEEQLKTLESANKSVERLESSFSALTTTLVAKAAPAISKFFDALTAGVSGNKLVMLRSQIDYLQSTIATAWDRGNLSPAEVELRKKQIADWQRQLRLTEPAVTHNRGLSLSGAEEAPPGFLPDITPFTVTQQKAIGNSRGINPVLDQWEQETKASLDSVFEQYRTFKDKTRNLLHEKVIDPTEYATRMEEAWSKFENEAYISPVVISQRTVSLAKYLTDAQRQVHEFVTDFKSSLQSAFDQGGNVGKNFVRNLIKALSDRTLFQAISSIGDALSASLNKAATAGGFGGFLGQFFGALYGSGDIGEFVPTQHYVPSYATGTSYVPRTGLAMIHQGERITPASENAGWGGGSGPAFHTTIYIGANNAVTRDEVVQAVAQGNKATIAQMRDMKARGRF